LQLTQEGWSPGVRSQQNPPRLRHPGSRVLVQTQETQVVLWRRGIIIIIINIIIIVLVLLLSKDNE